MRTFKALQLEYSSSGIISALLNRLESNKLSIFANCNTLEYVCLAWSTFIVLAGNLIRTGTMCRISNLLAETKIIHIQQPQYANLKGIYKYLLTMYLKLIECFTRVLKHATIWARHFFLLSNRERITYSIYVIIVKYVILKSI